MRSDRDLGAHSPISVIMTALNESRHLAESVGSVFAQDYKGPIELVVSVGPSRDETLAVAQELARGHEGMRVVDNPTGRTPAGLNIAIAATDQTRPVIVRTDGHAHLPPDYVRLAVEDLQRTQAANVGGMMVPAGTTPFESAVARAMSERIGLGSAQFHVGGAEGPADTVYLGVFRRSALVAVGGFDEFYRRAQDWELNHRIRADGGVVWFDPRLKVGYRPRGSLRALARQFATSGMWRWQIVHEHPETASLRYLAAPAAAAAIAVSTTGLVLAAVTGSAGLAVAAAVVPVGYLGVVVTGAVATRRDLDARASGWYPLVLVTMHMSWGSGFVARAALDGVQAVRKRWHRVRPSTAAVRGAR